MIVTTGLVLGLGSIPVGVSFADEFENTSTIGINRPDANNNFTGSVSANGRCKRNRNVTLIKARRRKSNVVAGRTTTNRFGNWKIEKPSPRGRYFARVSRRLNTRYGHRHDCKGDRSPTIKVER